MGTVLISGGNGLVGRRLAAILMEKGYDVVVLTTNRQNADGVSSFFWNVEAGEIDDRAVLKSDYIIHLAGANIGEKRWTNARRKLIVDSRVLSAQLIFDAVTRLNVPTKAFISSSATGYYGAVTSQVIFEETAPAATDFLGTTCRLWEQAADQFADYGIRTVKVRTGVVLTKVGGALARMIPAVRMGFGSPLGDGLQYMPWIHIDDLCRIYIMALEDARMNGAFNAVAPDHRTNREFLSSLAGALARPFWAPNVPAFVLKLLYGEMSDIILKGSRVSSEKIRNAGFDFEFPMVYDAFSQIFQRRS